MAKEDAKGAKVNAGSAEELRYIQQVYQNQYAMATNSINMLFEEMNQLNNAQKTLERIDVVEGRDMLSNIGANSFLLSRVQNSKTALMAVGGRYLVEKDIDSAKGRLAALIQRRTDMINRIMKERKELEAALIEVSYRLDSMR